MSLERLKKTYVEQGLVLALGAGVSTGAGLPGWRELLQRIGRVCLGEDGPEIVCDLMTEGFSLPAIAGMLKASCREGTDFPDIVRDVLYGNFPFYPNGVNEGNSQSIVDHIQKSENQTLNAVASLCAVRDKRYDKQKFYVRNPNVHAIMNFNIDAVLREYIEARYPRKNRKNKSLIVRTVERASKSKDHEKISVYHLHGYLRFDPKAKRPDKEAFDKLVFAEQEYFDFFNSATSLFNYTFLYMLREYSCLFIGLSMQDDNIRRLLHYSRKERVQAYEEEKKKRTRAEIEAKVLRHFVILRKFESESKKQLIEGALNYLGALVLWVDEYEHIPKLLGEVYAFGGNDWSTVYENLATPSERPINPSP
jgi:hypothetical protein